MLFLTFFTFYNMYYLIADFPHKMYHKHGIKIPYFSDFYNEK